MTGLNYSPPAGGGASGAPAFLEIADAIGCRLVRDAIWSEERCNWQIWSKEPLNGTYQSVYRAASMDLYIGVARMALFLACLARVTGDVHQRVTVMAAVRQLEFQLGRCTPAQFGMYTGSSGVAWAMAVIGDILGESRWIKAGIRALQGIAETAEIQGNYDLLGGQAGLVLALVTASEQFNASALVPLAARVADALVAAAERRDGGASWGSAAGETRNLLGCSHGVAGMALALLEINRLSPKPEYVTIAREALAYERNAFNPKQRNWPDYRVFPGVTNPPPGYPVAWCHGATGIGITRIRIHDLLPEDPLVLPEIDAALGAATTVLNSPLTPLNDFTLCHGALGNNELLLMIGDRFGRPDALAAAARVAEMVRQLCFVPRLPWTCGFTGCGESPSLMTGTAGIGLHYLRLHDRTGVPTILLPSRPTRLIYDHGQTITCKPTHPSHEKKASLLKKR